jgi:hypothetical protein
LIAGKPFSLTGFLFESPGQTEYTATDYKKEYKNMVMNEQKFVHSDID